MDNAARDEAHLDIDTLYRRFGPMVLRRGRRFLPPDAAEDVLHEVFVRALERLHAFRHEASPATWLFTVTTRLCLNRLRDHRRREALLCEHGPAAHAATGHGARDGHPEARAFLGEVWRHVLETDEELAMIGTLYHVDGMTTADIGAALGVSDRTIAARLQRLTALVRGHVDGGSR
jgi:RNA polymerase sigma factor (sigma-70 family)